MNRNRKINSNIINLKARRELERKQRINKIRSAIFTGIAMINMMLIMAMMLSAIFINYTDAEKNFMFVFLGVAVVCLFIADPKEFIGFFKDMIFNNDIDDYLYDEDYDDDDEEYDEDDNWI